MSQNLRDAIQNAITVLQNALEPEPAAETVDMNDPTAMFAALLKSMHGKDAAAKVAKADTMTSPVRTVNGVGARPTVVYAVVPNYSKKVAASQTGQVGQVFATVLKAGAKGIGASAVQSKLDIKSKSVQSAMWHLRHAGLIRSLSAETRKPIE